MKRAGKGRPNSIGRFGRKSGGSDPGGWNDGGERWKQRFGKSAMTRWKGDKVNSFCKGGNEVWGSSGCQRVIGTGEKRGGQCGRLPR